MLDPQTFKSVIENTPLVSIDLCLFCNGQILLGKRSNEPLKGKWFTPGGRIHKNETWQDALLRIVEVELGLVDVSLDSCSLMVCGIIFITIAPLIKTHRLTMLTYPIV